MNILFAWCTAFSLSLSLGPRLGLGSVEEEEEASSLRTENLLPVIVQQTVLLSNDGPVMWGSYITCYARLVNLEGNDLETKNQFLYEWEEDDYSVQDDQSNSTMLNFTRTYSRLTENARHTVKLKVYYYKDNKKTIKIAQNTTSFYVTEGINGHLEFSEGNATNLNKNSFETNKVLQILADVYDPSGFLENADIIYDWNVGNMYQTVTYNQPIIFYNFTLADVYQIGVNITAFRPEMEIYLKRLGYFTSSVYIKDKVSNVHVSGSSVVTEGDTHQYEITCNASLPAYLCSHLSPNSTCGEAVDECKPIEMSNNCSAIIELHFNASGTHCLSVNIANDVSNSGVTTNIEVKQLVIPHQKAISITIGVLFGVIACLISIFLVVQQVNKSRQRHIEVANFDFEEENHNSTLRKLTQNVKNTCKKVSLKMSMRGKKETEFRPLISLERDAHT